ncbi:hypothetical protein CR203_14515 [Salipaludibacillus neizhouensis]|uniref:DUF4268 domain-containing protein n=1 Tax=Salipaludibacillus neizhouensis TaxID=885475 RepID=A0A3A9K571_9BACI|nr:DUF4268 domain-containing protein [Salipaludibacillus neizhouensis]RKL66508.1 hypothetical protein CR203_14515 [Salipaludibacillus neizhouensis]
MYKVDMTNNELIEIETTNFSEQKIKEREHIEEWIRKSPQTLGEDLLIIGHEYDKFENNERLDLLALDTDGNLVIIETKQDYASSGVDFQVLKYCSYCSTLKPIDIIEIYEEYIKKFSLQGDAIDNILEFLDIDSQDILNNLLNKSQRIIIVGNEFDRRVLSVGAWLHQNGIDIKCISIKPYIGNNQSELLIDLKQLIPPQNIENYYIKKKVQNTKSQGDVYQSGNVIQFFEKTVENAKRKGHQAYYHPRKSYCTVKSGYKNISFTLIYQKSFSHFVIEVVTSDPEVKKDIFSVYQGNEDMITSKTQLEFKTESGKRNPDWGRIIGYQKIDNDVAIDHYSEDINNKFIMTIEAFKELFKPGM